MFGVGGNGGMVGVVRDIGCGRDKMGKIVGRYEEKMGGVKGVNEEGVKRDGGVIEELE